jgi:hypothetical protein
VRIGLNLIISRAAGSQYIGAAAVHPTRPNAQVAVAQDGSFAARAYFTNDGGTTWKSVELPRVAIEGVELFEVDAPVVTMDADGVTTFAFVGVDKSDQTDFVVVLRTADQGETFQSAVSANQSPGYEFYPSLTADRQSASPYRNAVYATWTSFFEPPDESSDSAIRLGRSHDPGARFAETLVDDLVEAPHYLTGAMPAVGPHGEVYVAWWDATDRVIRFDRSLDGGATFGVDTTVPTGQPALSFRIPAQNRYGVYPEPALEVDRSSGPHRGRLHLTWTGAGEEEGATRVLHVYSDDGGQTWSAPKEVSSAPAGSDQFNPTVAVDDATGTVTVVWRDTRHDERRRSVHVLAAQSRDGGETFEAPAQVTSEPTDQSCDLPGWEDPCDASGQQLGFHDAVVAIQDGAQVFWTDRRSGVPQDEEIFTSRLTPA